MKLEDFPHGSNVKTYTVILGLANSIVDEKGKTMCEFASHMPVSDPFITSVVEGLRARGDRVIVPVPKRALK